MCGLAGHIHLGAGPPKLDPEAAAAMTQRMCSMLAHRGPDGHGQWADSAAGIHLGHQRLSIIDLSPTGAQPMHSASRRYTIAYNGEIYGFANLARTLEREGARFVGTSDTEVLLAAIEVWGLKDALARINGMFAFALWDRHTATLSFARDRAGKKPLYIARVPTGLVFASELGPLIQHSGLDKTLNHDAVAMYMRYYAVPAPHTIFANAWKLPPASLWSFSPASPPDDIGQEIAQSSRYWSAEDVARSGQSNGEPQTVASVEKALSAAVAERLVSDVPLGAFLSGGIDSTCVVALMGDHAARKVDTFTIGFHEDGYDEAGHARAVAKALGTDHHEHYLTGAEARDVIPALPDIYSEPFADSSQIPTFLISRFARQHVTVALSGDGGDEVFGGYNRHIYAQRLSGALARLPQPLRSKLARLAMRLPPDTWDTLLRPLGQPQAGDRVHKLAGALATHDADELYQHLQSIWPDPHVLVPGAKHTAVHTNGRSLGSLASDMMLQDFEHYLPTDPLHKVDRASMAVSLEVRSPLLDMRVVEAAWALPEHQKIHHGQGKWPLRQIIAQRLPASMMQRPKQGFGVPMGDWLRGPLRGWAENLLTANRLGEAGILNPEPVRSAWEKHLSGRENLSARLWTVLMFQAWRQKWL